MTDLGSEKSRALISGSVTDFCCSGSHCPVFKILDRNMSESMCLTLVASFTERASQIQESPEEGAQWRGAGKPGAWRRRGRNGLFTYVGKAPGGRI